MYLPIRYPAAARILEINAAVEPLPLVPAIWTNFSLSWGFPSPASSVLILLSPRTLPYCSAFFRYWEASS